MKKMISIVIILCATSFIFLTMNLNNNNTQNDAEKNFLEYKSDRLAIISMLVNGEIQKEADRYGNEGFYFYYTPPEYMNAVKSDTLTAKMYSEEHYFVFFQSAEQPNFDMLGLTEGFLYSSTGKFPSAKEFGYFGDYKKMDEHWFFLSSDAERFANSCLNLCEK